MKAAKIVLSAGLLLVLAAIGGGAYLAIYLDSHRDLLESGASQALGRRIEVQDGVTVAWSMRPRFALDGVWIANPDWASGEHLARVDRVVIQLDLWALLRGRIEIQQLILQNADVDLESGPDGSANWVLGSEDHTDVRYRIDLLQARNSTLRYQLAGGVEHRLGVTALELAGLGGDAPALTAQVIYRDVPLSVSAKLGRDAATAAQGWPFTARLESGAATLEVAGRALAPLVLYGTEIEFDLQAQNLHSLQGFLTQEDLPEGPLRIAARLTVQEGNYQFNSIQGSMDVPEWIPQVVVTGGDATLSADGAVVVSMQGSWLTVPATLAFRLAAIADPENRRQLDLEVTLAGIELRSRGEIKASAADLEWDLDAELRGDDLAGLDAILTGAWRPDSPVVVTARVEKFAQAYAFADLNARFGDTKLSGGMQLRLDGPRPRLAGDLVAERLDLVAFAAGEQPAAEPASERAERPHWSDIPLPKGTMDAVDIDVRLKAHRLVAGSVQADAAEARVLIDNGRLQLEAMDLSLPGLRVTGEATLDTEAQPPALDLALRSERIDLPRALRAVSPSARIAGSLRKVSVRLKTDGATPRALIDNVSGEFEAASGRLTVPAGEGVDGKEIALTNTRIQARPKELVRLRTGLAVAGHTFTLDLTGGTLADLLRDKKPWKTIKVAARSEIDGQPTEIQGQVGPWSAVIAGRDLDLDLTARYQGLKAQLHGTLARLGKFPGRGLSLRLSGPSLARLAAVLGTEQPASEPFEITAQLEGGGGSLSLKGLESTIGDSDIVGEVRVLRGPKTRVEATLDSGLLDLTPHLPAGATTLDDAISDLARELPLELLHTLDGALRWRVRQLRIKDLGVRDLNLGATLDAGYLRLEMDAGQERLAADVELKPEDTVWRLTLNHKGKFDLDWLMRKGRGAGAAARAPVTLDVQINGVGRSPQALLASANGHIETILGAGRINEEVVSALPLSGILVALFDTIGSSGKDGKHTRLECAVIKLDVVDGIATSPRGIAVQTDRLNVLGAGTLNLSSGEIDFQFNTAQRQGLGISILGIADRFIRITGTLRKPEVVVDPKGLLIHGGGAWTTGGVTLLFDHLTDRLTSFSNPCDTVLEQTGE